VLNAVQLLYIIWKKIVRLLCLCIRIVSDLMWGLGIMDSLSCGKGTITHLNLIWRKIINTGTPSGEIVYRLDKLILKLDVIADKIFVKTVKADHILLNCLQLTEQFQSKINTHRRAALLELTRLEACVDSLVRKAHDFRIKAG
jgi:hypothetical protein